MVVKLSRRDLKPGMVIVAHLAGGGPSVQGRVVRVTRCWVHLVEHRMEANGVMQELVSARVLVPVERVTAIEVQPA